MNLEKGVPIRSVSRTISVLQAVNRRRSLSLMEIAREAEVPYPTACRIVQTLLFEGLIEREPARKRYRPTALVQSLSLGFQSQDRLVTAARRAIVDLTKRIGWPITIATRVGQDMMVRDSTHALSPLTLEMLYPGDTAPLLDCASGRAYAAFLPEDQRTALLTGLRQLSGAATSPMDTLSMFENGLLVETIRARGYATKGRDTQSAAPGKTASIAVPLFEDGELAGAMSLIYFASAKKMDDAVRLFTPELKATARLIADTLADGRQRAA